MIYKYSDHKPKTNQPSGMMRHKINGCYVYHHQSRWVYGSQGFRCSIPTKNKGPPSDSLQLRYGCGWILWFMLDMIYNWLVVWLPFFIFPYIGLLIIPNDFHIFQRGGPTTNQITLKGLSTNIHITGVLWKSMAVARCCSVWSRASPLPWRSPASWVRPGDLMGFWGQYGLIMLNMGIHGLV